MVPGPAPEGSAERSASPAGSGTDEAGCSGETSELNVEVSAAEVRRYLGYPRGRAPASKVADRLRELWTLAENSIRPRGAVRLVADSLIAPTGMPRPSPQVVVGLCTIGAGLEQEAARRGAAGEALDELILDAFGSAAAEAAAEALAATACALASGLGLFCERRISPGYGRWPVTAQPALLALLPSQALGVELSPGLMMSPRKSVSFAIRLGPSSAPTASPLPCTRCRQEPCPYRRGSGPSEADHEGEKP